MTLEDKLKTQVSKSTNAPTTKKKEEFTFKGLLESPKIKARFEAVMDKRAPQFMASIISLYQSEASLQKVDPMSIIASCSTAATLDLPIEKNLGYAWIVPYKGKAQFQMGYKGYIQLALRSGQYKALNVIDVHEGELKKWNPLTEELEIDFESRKSEAVIGYAGYFELLGGFRKRVYWSKEQIEFHRKKFSKSDFGWGKDYHAMARKTVLRNMLSKWGILSVEMQHAYKEEIEPSSPQEILGLDENLIDITPNDFEASDVVSEPEEGSNPPTLDEIPFELNE